MSILTSLNVLDSKAKHSDTRVQYLDIATE